jgi:hypothetical protein
VKPQSTTDLQSAYRMSVFITFSMMVSLVVYAAVVQIVRLGDRAPIASGALQVIRIVIFVSGLVVFVAARVARRAMLRKTAADGLEVLLGRLARASVVTSAFSEAPAVLGLALFFVGGVRTDFYAMALLSLVMFAMYFPRISVWKDWLGPAQHEQRA